MSTKLSRAERLASESADRLREWYPKGSTVYTVLRHCSRSGMLREIGMLSIIQSEDEPIIRHPNHATAEVLGLRVNKAGDGVRVGGAGMDMGYHLTYELSHALYGDGYALNHRWL